MSHASYMSRAFTDRNGIVKESDELLVNVEFDTFVGVGISGTLIAPLLADMGTGEHDFAIVRKADQSHSTNLIEGEFGWNDRFVFVDDCVDSGKTLVYVLNQIERSFDYVDKPVFVGAYLYQDTLTHGRFYTPEQLIEKLDTRARFRDFAENAAARLKRYI